MIVVRAGQHGLGVRSVLHGHRAELVLVGGVIGVAEVSQPVASPATPFTRVLSSELCWTSSRWLLTLPTMASVKNSNVPESLSGE